MKMEASRTRLYTYKKKIFLVKYDQTYSDFYSNAWNSMDDKNNVNFTLFKVSQALFTENSRRYNDF